ncbi:MAG: hypothetical protein ACOCV1_04000 [Bacillota bacterium]
MNQDITKKATLMQGSSKSIDINYLSQFAKNNCKRCFGRGYRTYVKCISSKNWKFDHYGVCACVLKGKKLRKILNFIDKMEEKSNEDLINESLSEIK